MSRTPRIAPCSDPTRDTSRTSFCQVETVKAQPQKHLEQTRKRTFVKAKVIKGCTITGNRDPETGLFKTFVAKVGDTVMVCTDTLRNLSRKGYIAAA